VASYAQMTFTSCLIVVVMITNLMMMMKGCCFCPSASIRLHIWYRRLRDSWEKGPLSSPLTVLCSFNQIHPLWSIEHLKLVLISWFLKGRQGKSSFMWNYLSNLSIYTPQFFLRMMTGSLHCERILVLEIQPSNLIGLALSQKMLETTRACWGNC
jgi:hypothetical protein